MRRVTQLMQRLGHSVYWAGYAVRSGDYGFPIASMQDGLDVSAFERAAERMRRSEAGRRLLAERPRVSVEDFERRGVLDGPEDSIGRAVYAHLAQAALLADVPNPESPFDMSDEAIYAKFRWRQTHDFRHVLTGLSTSLHDELVLQAFQLGQFVNWLAIAQISFGPLLAPWTCRPNHMWPAYWRAYRAGQRADFLLLVDWESMLDESVDAMREQLGVEKLGPLW